MNIEILNTTLKNLGLINYFIKKDEIKGKKVALAKKTYYINGDFYSYQLKSDFMTPKEMQQFLRGYLFGIEKRFENK